MSRKTKRDRGWLYARDAMLQVLARQLYEGVSIGTTPRAELHGLRDRTATGVAIAVP